MRKPNGLGAHRHRARDVPERDEAERTSHQPRLIERWPPVFPATVARHAVLHDQSTPRRQQEHHGVIGDFLDKRVGDVGDRNAFRSRGGDVDIVRTDSAKCDDLAAFKAVDHALGEFHALGIDRVGVVRAVDERILRRAVDLDDLGVKRRQRLVLDFISTAADGKACALRRHYLEFGHCMSLLT